MESTDCRFNFSYGADIDDLLKKCPNLFSPVDVEEPSYEETPTWTYYLLPVFLGVCCCLGLALNFLGIFMAIRCRKVPNFVRILICNLSLAHISFLSTLPIIPVAIVFGSWPFGTILCKCFLLITYIHHLVVPVLLAFLTFDRFLEECYPILAERWENSLISKLVHIAVWIVSAFFNIPVLLYSYIMEIGEKPTCQIFWRNDISQTVYVLDLFKFGFVIPLTAVLIFLILGASKSKSLSIGNETFRGRRPPNKRLKMLTIMLCALYFLCWAPRWAIQLVLVLPHDMLRIDAIVIAFVFSFILTYVNSVVCQVVYMVVVGRKSLRPSQDAGSSNEDNNADGTSSNLQLPHSNDEVNSNPLLSPRSHGDNGRMDATTVI